MYRTEEWIKMNYKIKNMLVIINNINKKINNKKDRENNLNKEKDKQNVNRTGLASNIKMNKIKKWDMLHKMNKIFV